MTATAPTHHSLRFDARWLVEVLALAALYFVTARLGLLMAIPGGHVTPVWPPSGIALAAILLRGRWVWPGIWLGSFAANFWDFYGSPMSLATELATAAVFGAGASLAALLGSQLLRRFVSERNPLERKRISNLALSNPHHRFPKHDKPVQQRFRFYKPSPFCFRQEHLILPPIF